MSHGDQVMKEPAGFEVLASTATTPVAAFANSEKKIYGVQWHPEVKHSQFGQNVLENFLHNAAGISPDWNSGNVIAQQVEKIKTQVGNDRVICGLSGGVDSAVAAALVHKAVGDQLVCIFVNHGLLREGEVEQVERDYVASTGVRLITVDAEKKFLDALAGVTDPETKRKIIGREFIRSFEEAQAQLIAESKADNRPVKFLVQGTLYPDVVESGGGVTAGIKSHHNVGGLPEDLQFELVEPLRTLFKDEVRAIGYELGLPKEIVGRQPFPGPGLGIRIVGEVTKERLELLRKADAIVRAELSAAGLDGEIWQCPVVLLADVRSVGVQGDGRSYGHPIVLRPVSSEDAMTADWSRVPYDLLAKISNRITNEVAGVNRVVLDVTSKPPGTIEWEQLRFQVNDLNEKVPLVFAHRGASGYRPENTLEAFELGIAQGADGIEFDIVSTKDSQLIIRHENVLSQTTNILDVAEFKDFRRDGMVEGVEHSDWFSEDLNLQDIKRLRAVERIADVRPGSAKFDGQFTIPTLLEVLQSEFINNKIAVLEFKSGSHLEKFEGSVTEFAAEHVLESKAIERGVKLYVESFDLELILDAKAVFTKAGIDAQYFLAIDSTKMVDCDLEFLANNFDGLSIATHMLLSTDTWVDSCHALGLDVWVYTARAENATTTIEAYYEELIQTGVDGIFADQPDLLRRVLTERG